MHLAYCDNTASTCDANLGSRNTWGVTYQWTGGSIYLPEWHPEVIIYEYAKLYNLVTETAKHNDLWVVGINDVSLVVSWDMTMHHCLHLCLLPKVCMAYTLGIQTLLCCSLGIMNNAYTPSSSCQSCRASLSRSTNCRPSSHNHRKGRNRPHPLEPQCKGWARLAPVHQSSTSRKK